MLTVRSSQIQWTACFLDRWTGVNGWVVAKNKSQEGGRAPLLVTFVLMDTWVKGGWMIESCAGLFVCCVGQ